MRAKGLLVAGLAALVVGILGLIAVVPSTAAQAGPGGWEPGAGGMMWGPGGMMGRGGMAGLMGGPVDPATSPIGIDRAEAAARDYVARLGDESLELGEVMEFLGNYYVQVVEQDSGIHAFELLVDRYSGAVFPEMGPNMVWNTRYGHMSGMAGRRGFARGSLAEMPIGPERAREIAARYLETQGLPLAVGEADRFHGYYTLHTLRNGAVEGMLSVNGHTGEVWYHVWHGPYIRSQQPDAAGSQGGG